MIGWLLLVAGCVSTDTSATQSPTASGGPTTTGSGSTIPAPGTPSTGDSSTTGSGTTTTSTKPACYTVTKPVGGTTWSLAQVPDANGPVTIISAFNPNALAAVSDPAGLAWFDGAWWSCMGGRVAQLDPVSLDITITSLDCKGLVGFPNELGVNIDGPLGLGMDFYDSGAAVLSGLPTSSSMEAWDTLVHGASDGVTLWDGYSAVTFLNQYDLATGAHTQMPLTGFTQIVEGVGLLDGNLWVLDDGRLSADYRIRVHEYDTVGAALSAVAIGEYGVDFMYGLWCGTP